MSYSPEAPITDVLGLSFFFRDDLELDAFLRHAGLPAEWQAEESRIRAALGVVPRTWIKLLFRQGTRVGEARYYAFPPARELPFTSIRLLFQHLGGGAHAVEPILAPLDGREGVGVFVSRKLMESVSTARLSVRFSSEWLPDYGAYLVESGLVDADLMRFHLGVAETLSTDRVYLTLEPGRSQSLAVDYREQVGYRKCRRVDGEARWRYYRRLNDLLREQADKQVFLQPIDVIQPS